MVEDDHYNHNEREAELVDMTGDPDSDDQASDDDRSLELPPLRRLGRAINPVTRLDPTLRGQSHNDITLFQCGHPDIHFTPIPLCFAQWSLKMGLNPILRKHL